METTATTPALSNEAQARARKVHHLATTGETTGERTASWARLMDMSVEAHLPLPDFLMACGLSLAEGAGGEAPPQMTMAADFRRLKPAVGSQKGMIPLVLHDAETLAATIVVAALQDPSIVPQLLDASAKVASMGDAARATAASICNVRAGDDAMAAMQARLIRDRMEVATGG